MFGKASWEKIFCRGIGKWVPLTEVYHNWTNVNVSDPTVREY